MNVEKVGPKAIEAYVQKTQAATDKVPPQTAKEVTKPAQDEVTISKQAREMQEAQKAVQNAPDIRQEKIASIKKQIQEGTYNVPAEAVVDKLLSIFKNG